MPFHTTPARRQLVVVLLLAFAVVGGAIRYWAPNPSTLRDLGSLMLVLWVPVIGNVIAFLVRRVRLRRTPFDLPFAPELLLEISPLAPPPRLAQPLAGDGCALVVGTEGFTVRLSQPLSAWLAAGRPVQVQAQFLKPGMALARFAPETPFRIVARQQLVGQGRVLQVLPTRDG
ncbi:hypothetical protein ACFPOE_12210 [Caenimonas terrae]|uniref:Phosphatidylserine decarboxylase family protein n=1 Tax=Caenimonas terrae TaxID=696074 RepID=A0ABW0NCI4_9BURK